MTGGGRRARLLVVDTCVLINLAIIDRLDLVTSLATFRPVVTDEVVGEIKRPEIRERVDRVLASGLIERVRLEGPDALTTFAQMRRRMGPADAACVAYALAEDAVLATDDGRMQREIRERLGPNHLVSTPGILLAAIRAGRITVHDADRFKALLAENRFRMSFTSFRDRLDHSTL